ASQSAALRGELASIVSRTDATGGASDIEQARLQRMRGLAERDQAQAGLQAAAGRNTQRQQRGEIYSFADQLASLDRVKSANEAIASAGEKTVAVLRQQSEERKRNVVAAENELATAQKTAATEKDRFRSAEAKFGRLDAVQQNRAKQISEGGVKSVEDAKFLESIGLGTGKAESFFADKGRAAGAGNVLAGLGDRSALDEAQGRVTEFQQALTKARQEASESNRDLLASNEALRSDLQRLSESVRELARVQAESKGLDPDQIDPGKVASSLQNAMEEITGAVDQLAKKMREHQTRVAANQL
ncbi:MAG: hypothetical protein ACK5Q5_00675, partial [Planctomycetaceae bacterium]